MKKLEEKPVLETWDEVYQVLLDIFNTVESNQQLEMAFTVILNLAEEIGDKQKVLKAIQRSEKDYRRESE